MILFEYSRGNTKWNYSYNISWTLNARTPCVLVRELCCSFPLIRKYFFDWIVEWSQFFMMTCLQCRVPCCMYHLVRSRYICLYMLHGLDCIYCLSSIFFYICYRWCRPKAWVGILFSCTMHMGCLLSNIYIIYYLCSIIEYI